MGQMAKYEGVWIPMDRYIRIKEAQRQHKIYPPIVDETPVESEVKIITPAKVVDVIPEDEHVIDLKVLREEYKKVSGKGISPRYLNDADWLQANISEYKNNK